MNSFRSDRAHEFATLFADHRHDGGIPNFGDADAPAEMRALAGSPAPPGGSHFLNGDARRLLSLSRLASSCQQRHAPLQDRPPRPLVPNQDDRRLDVGHVRTAVHRRRGQARNPLVEIDFGRGEGPNGRRTVAVTEMLARGRSLPTTTRTTAGDCTVAI